MKGIDSNSSLLDNYNYDAQQIVDYIRDFAAFEGSMKGLLSIFTHADGIQDFNSELQDVAKRLCICMEGRNECPVQR